MIYTVTFNPAIDYVMQTKNLKTGITNRSLKEEYFYGGKGINVSTIGFHRKRIHNFTIFEHVHHAHASDHGKRS